MTDAKEYKWVESVGRGADLYLAWPDSVHVLSAEYCKDNDKKQKWKWQVAAVVGSKPVVNEGHTEEVDEAKRAAEEAFDEFEEKRKTISDPSLLYQPAEEQDEEKED